MGSFGVVSEYTVLPFLVILGLAYRSSSCYYGTKCWDRATDLSKACVMEKID